MLCCSDEGASKNGVFTLFWGNSLSPLKKALEGIDVPPIQSVAGNMGWLTWTDLFKSILRGMIWKQGSQLRITGFSRWIFLRKIRPAGNLPIGKFREYLFVNRHQSIKFNPFFAIENCSCSIYWATTILCNIDRR